MQAHAIGHHIEHFDGLLLGFFLTTGGQGDLQLALGLHSGKAAGGQPLLQLLRRGAGGQLHRKGEHQARLGLACGHVRGHAVLQGLIDGVGVVVLHGQRGVLVKQLAGAGKQEFEVVVELGHGAHGGA